MVAVKHRLEVLLRRKTAHGESWQNRAGNVALLHRDGTRSWVARVDGRWLALVADVDDDRKSPAGAAVFRLARLLSESHRVHVLFEVPDMEAPIDSMPA